MYRHTWVDSNGIRRPYWCRFEFQAQRPGANHFRKDESGEGTVLHALLHARTQPTEGEASPNAPLVPIGDLKPISYNFGELGVLVRAIKTYCVENNTNLPNVEAVPVTIGMADEIRLATAKKQADAATHELALAEAEWRRFLASKSVGPRAPGDVPIKEVELRLDLSLKLHTKRTALAALSHAEKEAAATKMPPLSPYSKAPEVEPITDDEEPTQTETETEIVEAGKGDNKSKRRAAVTPPRQDGDAAKRPRHY
ncbi:hypothetical protein DV735_g4986, partial [Chaetothyriales sp. CBS 134920]